MYTFSHIDSCTILYFSSSTGTDDPIHFGREPQNQCVGVPFVCESCIPFENEIITAREDTTFQARIGPSGNERGYMGITGILNIDVNGKNILCFNRTTVGIL